MNYEYLYCCSHFSVFVVILLGEERMISEKRTLKYVKLRAWKQTATIDTPRKVWSVRLDYYIRTINLTSRIGRTRWHDAVLQT